MNGLEKFPLVLPDSGVVHLPHQFGVLVDEPRLPENIRSCVFHLRCKQNQIFSPEPISKSIERHLLNVV